MNLMAAAMFTRITAAQAELEAMKAENRLRQAKGLLDAYGREHFYDIVDKMDAVNRELDTFLEPRVARAIYTAMKPQGLTISDWDSGSMLGRDDTYRHQINIAAKLVIKEFDELGGINTLERG